MAYARRGEHGSDIDVYREGPNVWICQGCPFSQMGWSVYLGSYGDLGIHLLQHLTKGHQVPDQVFDRIMAEMEGLPWETDVERAIKEVHGDEGSCICRTLSCGHRAYQHGAGGYCKICGVECWK